MKRTRERLGSVKRAAALATASLASHPAAALSGGGAAGGGEGVELGEGGAAGQGGPVAAGVNALEDLELGARDVLGRVHEMRKVVLDRVSADAAVARLRVAVRAQHGLGGEGAARSRHDERGLAVQLPLEPLLDGLLAGLPVPGAGVHGEALAPHDVVTSLLVRLALRVAGRVGPAAKAVARVILVQHRPEVLHV